MPGRSPIFPLAEGDPMLAARWPSDYDDSDAGGDSQETIYLLQQEVERLEAELRMRDDSAPAAAPAASVEEELAAREALMTQLRGLLAEVAGRDQTIGLLHEQVHYLEQLASSARADGYLVMSGDFPIGSNPQGDRSGSRAELRDAALRQLD